MYNQYNIPQPAPDAADIEISGLGFTAGQLATGEWLVTGPMPPWGDLVVLAPAHLTQQEVIGIVESVPALDPRRFSPADGHNDLRALFSEGGVTQVLVAAGAVNIEPVEIVAIPPGSGNQSTRVEFSFELPGSAPAFVKAIISLYSDRIHPERVAEFPGIRSLGDVDVFIQNVQPDAPTGQAMAFCGGVIFNFSINYTAPLAELPNDFQPAGDPVLDALTGVLSHLEC